MSVPPVAQPGIPAEGLEQPAWLAVPRVGPAAAARHLKHLGEHHTTALPLDDGWLEWLWRGVRAEQGR